MDLWMDESVVLAFRTRCLLNLRITLRQIYLLCGRIDFSENCLDHNLSWRAHIYYLEERIDWTPNALLCIAVTKWGSTSDSLLKIHVAIVHHIIAYSLPVMHGLSESPDPMLINLITWSLKICFRLPRLKLSSLIILRPGNNRFKVYVFRKLFHISSGCQHNVIIIYCKLIFFRGLNK